MIREALDGDWPRIRPIVHDVVTEQRVTGAVNVYANRPGRWLDLR